jgi:hypothetical protein
MLIDLIENAAERETLGRNALAALESQRGATGRTVAALLALMSARTIARTTARTSERTMTTATSKTSTPPGGAA